MLDFLVKVYLLINLVQAQYYQPDALSPSSFLNNNPSSTLNGGTEDEFVEQKYVNSGQSIILICDLPNNMPDGKVCNYLIQN